MCPEIIDWGKFDLYGKIKNLVGFFRLHEYMLTVNFTQVYYQQNLNEIAPVKNETQ